MIERHDNIGLSHYGRSEHMTIVRIRQSQTIYQAFISRYGRIRNRLASMNCGGSRSHRYDDRLPNSFGLFPCGGAPTMFGCIRSLTDDRISGEPPR